jgi:membrane glycosyltransferase
MSNFLSGLNRLGSPSSTAIFSRRFIFAVLVILTLVVLAIWLTLIVVAGGYGVVVAIMVGAFLIKAAWVVIMFWNSAFGFALQHGMRHPLDYVIPPNGRALAEDLIVGRNAIVMTVCNEDPIDVFARIRVLKEALDCTGFGEKFDYFILSDSSDSDVVVAEERMLNMLRVELIDERRIIYRRRKLNLGFQHGNLRDFVDRWGQNYEFMVVLDADSLMTADAVLRLVRIMQANPRIGILQSLIVGVLSPSLLARVFEFGHRHGMRCSVFGAVWWQGPRGQYRGHNAAIRIAPYTEHCRIADLPGDEPFAGIMFCHDQIESILMHRAGFEVWELPVEGGSYEGMPPSVLDFSKRYNRWFQGNLNNLKALCLPCLTILDRYHLISVAHRFLGWPALVTFIVLAAFTAATWPANIAFQSTSALALYAVYLCMYFAPRTLGLLDAILRSPSDYGGTGRLLLGGITDVVFTFMFMPIVIVGATFFIFARTFGLDLRWDTQRRTAYRLSWIDAQKALWPHSVFGIILIASLATMAAGAIPWFLPFVAGLILAIPFSVLSSSAELGRWALQRKLCVIPEEIQIPREIVRLRMLIEANTTAAQRNTAL